MQTIIEAGLREMNLTGRVPPEASAQLARFGALLLEKNQVMNLTAIREPEQAARLHMLDCAALLLCAGFEGKTLIDVGTGAGFPGVPLKILVPSLQVTLADSLGKRVDWLGEACQSLELSGVARRHARAEELALEPGFRDSFDFAVSRAVASLPLLCELCLPFVKVGGRFLAMKGPECEEEMAQAAGGIARLGGQLRPSFNYRIPGTEVVHRVVQVEKIAPTPKGYPRRWAKIVKAPL